MGCRTGQDSIAQALINVSGGATKDIAALQIASLHNSLTVSFWTKWREPGRGEKRKPTRHEQVYSGTQDDEFETSRGLRA